MFRIRTRRRDHYQFSNIYPVNTTPLPFLPTTATRTTTSVTLSISTTSIHPTATRYTSTALTTVTTPRSNTIPSKIPVTNLPPWEQPFLKTRRRHHSLRLVHTVCRQATSLGLGKATRGPHHFPTTSTGYTRCPILCPSLSTTAHLSDSLVHHQKSHSRPDPGHPSIFQISTVTTRRAVVIHSLCGGHSSALFSPISPSPSSRLLLDQRKVQIVW
jgi:hypothetical protein